MMFFLFYCFTFLLSDANIVLANSREKSHSRDLLNIKRAVLRFGAARKTEKLRLFSVKR